MSFALQFTERALDGLRKMEAWLQEETLDVIDTLAFNPPTPTNRRLAGAVVCDFIRTHGESQFYVFLTLFPDPPSRVIRISEVGFWTREGAKPGG